MYLFFHRIKCYIKSGLSEKELKDPDGGIHLAKKKAELGVIKEVQPELKTAFPELIDLPNVTFRTIWTYMVACINAKKQLSTAKPMIKGLCTSWVEFTNKCSGSTWGYSNQTLHCCSRFILRVAHGLVI